MSLIITAKVWFEIDTAIFGQPCGFFNDPNQKNAFPVFSKELALKTLREVVERYDLSDDEIQILVASIESSSLPNRFGKLDAEILKLCMRQEVDGAPEIDELGYVEALKRRIAAMPVQDDSQRLTVGEVGNGKAAKPEEDIELIIDSEGVVHGVLKCGNVMTQPFFSKTCGRNCVEGITRRFQFSSEVVRKAYAAIEALDILPEEPAGHDHAAARFMRMCVETRRSKKAFDHIYKLIELGIFLDLFGDEGDPP